MLSIPANALDIKHRLKYGIGIIISILAIIVLHYGNLDVPDLGNTVTVTITIFSFLIAAAVSISQSTYASAKQMEGNINSLLARLQAKGCNRGDLLHHLVVGKYSGVVSAAGKEDKEMKQDIRRDLDTLISAYATMNTTVRFDMTDLFLKYLDWSVVVLVVVFGVSEYNDRGWWALIQVIVPMVAYFEIIRVIHRAKDQAEAISRRYVSDAVAF